MNRSEAKTFSSAQVFIFLVIVFSLLSIRHVSFSTSLMWMDLIRGIMWMDYLNSGDDKGRSHYEGCV